MRNENPYGDWVCFFRPQDQRMQPIKDEVTRKRLAFVLSELNALSEPSLTDYEPLVQGLIDHAMGMYTVTCSHEDCKSQLRFPDHRFTTTNTDQEYSALSKILEKHGWEKPTESEVGEYGTKSYCPNHLANW